MHGHSVFSGSVHCVFVLCEDSASSSKVRVDGTSSSSHYAVRWCCATVLTADLWHAAINMSETNKSEINKDVGKQMSVDDAVFTDKLSKTVVIDYLKMLIYGDPLRSEIAETFTLDVVHEITECFIRTLQKRHLGVRARINGSATVTVIGDIHGNIAGLRRILAPRLREHKRSMYIFLGDYVDKDDRGVEVMLTIMLLRLLMPKTCVTLRGNHEDVRMNRGLKEYGFYNDCTLYYKDSAEAIFNEITRVYAYLPLACVLNGSLFFVHGGLPEDIEAGLALGERDDEHCRVVLCTYIVDRREDGDHTVVWCREERKSRVELVAAYDAPVAGLCKKLVHSLLSKAHAV